jgi:hypothetical protein
MALPEPVTGLIVLGSGWLLGKADRWFSHNSNTERDTVIALRELSFTMKHLDNSVSTLNSAIGELSLRINNHERRISHIEGRAPMAPPLLDP